jgi:hypothetical protein
MEYVMVPVPEELVAQVKDYMSWQLNAPKVAENPEAVRHVLDAADPKLQTMVRYVAEVTADDGVPTLTDIGAAADMTPREVMGCIGDLGARLFGAGRAQPLILPGPDIRDRPEGVSEYAHKVARMSRADAEAILGF